MSGIQAAANRLGESLADVCDCGLIHPNITVRSLDETHAVRDDLRVGRVDGRAGGGF